MDNAWAISLAVCFGMLLGAAITMLLVFSVQRGNRAAEVIEPELPDGVVQVLEASNLASLVVDASNNVILASTPAIALGLVQPQGLVAVELESLLAKVRADGDALAEQQELVRAHDRVHVRVHVTRLGTRYLLVLVDDLTESLRVDAVRRDFLANVSHELKTPIAAIQLLSETLKEVPDDPKLTQRYARKIRKEARRLGRITQGIIELGRIQSADLLSRAVLVPVDSVVAGAVDAHEVLAEDKQVTIIVRRDKRGVVVGDENMLVTALGNVLENAIDYSPAGGTIGIGVTHKGGKVLIAVTDQGEGIDKKDQARVFERFYRADPSRDRKTGGTGLGLSIVKHISELHGGEVTVWSRPGMGSTFTITLPEPPASVLAEFASELPEGIVVQAQEGH